MSTTPIEPITHDITADRAPGQHVPVIRHWQAAPLRLSVSPLEGIDISEAATIRAEIHASAVSDGASMLAAVNVDPGDGTGPWVMDFTTAQMTIPMPKETRECHLIIAALWENSERIEPLARRRLILRRSNLFILSGE